VNRRTPNVSPVEAVELASVSEADWQELIAGEVEPWGGIGEKLSWAEKERYVAMRGAGKKVLALAGAVVADVEVEGNGRFQVLGIGGVFVTASERGRGLARAVARELLERARRDARCPERAMLFCRPQLAGLYRKLEFREIGAPVWAEQPRGRIEMPLRALWRPLDGGVKWPPGRVDVRGLPF
jgi:GNAT superfamily N-acetyltransferase